MRVLPVGCLGSEEGAERLSVRLRRILPIGPDWIPALAKTFLVGVAILRDDGRDPLGVADGEAEARRRTIVKDVDRKKRSKPMTSVKRLITPAMLSNV
jgi:hypothetical protein